jgi:hypothetical protein
MIIHQIRRLGDLAPELDDETAIDALWIFNDPGHYAALVTQRGWSEQTFRRWLADRMHDALLPD